MKLTALLFIAFTAAIARADKDTELKPTLVKPNKILFEDAFTAPALGPLWHVRQGSWVVKDGAVAGAKAATSEHPGKLDLKLPMRDAVLKFSFKNEAAGGLDLFFYQGETRVAAAMVRAGNLGFSTYPKTGPSKATMLGNTECKFATGEWHTVLIERKGGALRITTDGGAKLEVTGTSLDEETTSLLFNLRMPGEAACLLDDVKIWQAE